MDKAIKTIQELKGMIYKSKQPLMNREMGKIDMAKADEMLNELYQEFQDIQKENAELKKELKQMQNDLFFYCKQEKK